jgi:hypothetical protein
VHDNQRAAAWFFGRSCSESVAVSSNCMDLARWKMAVSALAQPRSKFTTDSVWWHGSMLATTGGCC